MNYQRLSMSRNPRVRLLVGFWRWLRNISLPAPRILVLPLLWSYLALRVVYHAWRRAFVCEPLLKAYCTSCGRNVHTDIEIPWIKGKGDLILEDNVRIDGKFSVSFAARFAARPRLVIGEGCHIGHACSFTVGKEIVIGKHCLVAADVVIADSPGHPKDPQRRLAGDPPPDDSVQPVRIGDNVWIGRRAMIMPGITVGDGSIVGAGSIVTHDVAPRTVVGGNPAKVLSSL